MTRLRNSVRLAGLAAVGFAMGVAFGAAFAPVTATAADAFAAMKVSRAQSGTDAPVFRLTTLDGQAVDSSSLHGKVVVLNFWATWCGPCKEEMPALERLRQRVDAGRVVVAAVTADLQREGIRAFVKQLELGFPVWLDEDRSVSAAFLVRGLPTTVFIGADGKLAGRVVGPREWDSPEALALIRRIVETGP